MQLLCNIQIFKQWLKYILKIGTIATTKYVRSWYITTVHPTISWYRKYLIKQAPNYKIKEYLFLFKII